MELWVIIFLIIGLFFFTFLIALLLIYNGLVRLKNNIKKSWANIDVLLKQRSDELPNLIASVKGYMEHERATLEALTKARTDVLQAPTFSKKAAIRYADNRVVKNHFCSRGKLPDFKSK